MRAVAGLVLSHLAYQTFAGPVPTNDQLVLSPAPVGDRPTPLVIWHGLGDTALSDGITSFIDDIKKIYPGIFVHSVQIPAGGSNDEEKRAGFWGKAEDQAFQGCEQLKEIPELEGGYDGMGFSQGGLFLRWCAQFSDGPPMRNLITFGTPHMGIAALIPCPTPPTLTCKLAAAAARNGIYTAWAQSHLIQAQYYRDPGRFEEYLTTTTFLRDLNAEGLGLPPPPDGATRREDGGKGVRELENLIAIMFEADRTVSPAESAHWGSYASDNKTAIIDVRDTPLYRDDWVGLKSLEDKGRLRFEHCPGEHMDLETGDCAKRVIDRWVGWTSDRP